MGQTQIEKPIRDYATFLRERYGEAVYRVPIDLGLGCPNRTGGRPGCTFCGGAGARAVHLSAGMSLEDQVRAGIQLARERYHATGFLAYFQAYTATHTPARQLDRLLRQVLDLADFRGVILATRPDCLPPETLDVLGDLAGHTDTWVELGVQSANDGTLRRVRRGHDFACAAAATRELTTRAIHVAPHVILGLPGETAADMQHTAAALGGLPFSGIKIHNLHVLARTPLAEQWRQGEIPVWDEHEYGEILMDFLRHIPFAWPVMRMVTDSPTDALLAPRWWMNKGQFTQYVERQMTQRGWRQGDLAGTPARSTAPAPPPSAPHPDPKLKTQRLRRLPAPEGDLSKHTLTALLAAVRLPDLRQPGRLVVLDVAFGQGPLCIEAMRILPRIHSGSIRLIGLGTEPGFAADLQRQFPDESSLMDTILVHRSLRFDWGNVSVYWGDPRRHLFRLRGMADLVLVEPAQIDRCVQVYTLDFLRRISRVLKPGGVLLSPSSDMPFRGALDRLGLHVGTAVSDWLPGGGTVACTNAAAIRVPLAAEDRNILRKTLSGIPYRDHNLVWSRKRIIQHREEVLARMRGRGWPKRLPQHHSDDFTA